MIAFEYERDSLGMNACNLNILFRYYVLYMYLTSMTYVIAQRIDIICNIYGLTLRKGVKVYIAKQHQRIDFCLCMQGNGSTAVIVDRQSLTLANQDIKHK